MRTRAEKTEICYRSAMRKALIDLLVVMNPEDQITFGAMTYSELVAYARDWLNTEIEELSSDTVREITQKFTAGKLASVPYTAKPVAKKMKDLVGSDEPAGLSLD